MSERKMGPGSKFEEVYDLSEIDVAHAADTAGLTPKQETILWRLQAGYDRLEIAYQLKVQRVDNHIYAIRDKLVEHNLIGE